MLPGIQIVKAIVMRLQEEHGFYWDLDEILLSTIFCILRPCGTMMNWA